MSVFTVKFSLLICWHLGASQGDVASLKGEDVDWENSPVSFIRKKTGLASPPCRVFFTV